MGAAMVATSQTSGTVYAPGYRYHPVIVAQVGATLAQILPNPFSQASRTLLDLIYRWVRK
jgi:hypothetical protein